jgi:hypothetical protein
MAYLGKGPEQVLSGVASKSTFTGDGSTTTFDISTDIPAGGENDIQVFVDNVRQEPGSGASYTVGIDGSGNLRRITFNTAPEASQSIYVINPRRIEAFGQVPDNTIATAKVQDLAVSTAKIAADAITEAKIADDAISEEHLDITSLTGQTELSATAADDDVLLIYDTSAGTLKKIQKSNVALQAPSFSSVSPTSLITGDGTGNYTIVVTGTKFDATATFTLITSGGTEISMDSVSRDSSTQLTGTVAKNTANLTNANEPFDVKITNGNSLTTTSADQINIDAQPVYTTSAGSLGTVDGGSAISTIDIEAADPDSAGNVTFELQSGTIPPGLSTATVNENGVSKFRITGTPTNPASTTTYNFTLRAADAASNTSSRAFSITVTRIPVSESFTSSGTFSVPSGIIAVDAIVVGGGGAGGHDSPPGATGGGGGGAGGLIFMPEYPVTPGGTITVTVGCGGPNAGTGSPTTTGCASNGQDTTFGSPGDPGLGTGGVLTAKGGGGGGYYQQAGKQGGSGSGAGRDGNYQTGGRQGGTANQPTQPGNSGAYGFGSAGGASGLGPGPVGPTCTGQTGGGGGGGAGAVGAQGHFLDCAAPYAGGTGGDGKAYTIADGTTPVYYAGGGGGASNGAGSILGGQGGGGDYNPLNPSNQGDGDNGTANRGGGGGAARGQSYTRGAGGKGIVIVRY